jgi:hypothetical protein
LTWAFRQAALDHVEVPVTVTAFLAFEDPALRSASPHPFHHLHHLSDDVVPVVPFWAAQ